MIITHYKWSFLFSIVLLITTACSQKDSTQKEENANPKSNTTQVEKDTLPKRDTTVSLKFTFEVRQVLPPGFEQIKKKCKYLNLREFDLRKEKGDYFTGYKTVTKEEFYRLKLDTVREQDTTYIREYNPPIYLYAFQENVNGRVGVVIGYIAYGISATLELFVYDKYGNYVDSENVANSGGDAGYIVWKRSKFVSKSDLQIEAKTYYLKEKNVCDWMKQSVKFPEKGYIIRLPLKFIIRSDSVPCNEKFQND